MENSYEEEPENQQVEEKEEHEEEEEEQEQENDEEQQEDEQNVEGEDEEEEAQEEEQVEENEVEQEDENNEDENEQQEEQENQEEVEEETEQNEEEGEEADQNSENANNESDEEFTGFGEEEIPVLKSNKKRQILSDDSEEEEDNKEKSDDEDESVSRKKKKHKKHKSHKKSHKKRKNKEEGGEDEEDETVGEDEDEEEGAEKEVQEELEELNEEEQPAQQDEEINDDEASNDAQPITKKNTGEQTNLERVLANQKAENKRKNKRKNVDSEELNEIDNTISMIIAEMKNVAAEDRAANEKSLTSIGKIKMLPQVITLLQKSDYHSNMIDLGILGAIAEWLAPLPDRSLPNIKIREALIDALRDFGDIGAEYLKSSGVGKAVMFLYKHPKEAKTHKQKLEKLIHNWSRPIFNLDANFKALSKEERLQRDIEQVRSMRRNSGDGQGQTVDELLSINHKKKRKARPGNESDRSETEDPNKVLRPGDAGFIPRARVPAPSHKDYVIRPKSNIEVMENNAKKSKKSESRLEKHQKKFVEFKRSSKFQRAVTLSINDKS